MKLTKVKLISHRGNILGPNPERENKPDYIEEAIYKYHFDCEIDVWRIDGKFFLGHDGPETPVTFPWLVEHAPYLWIHCKNVYALAFLQNTNLHHFWHDKDQFTLTSKNRVWAYPTATPFECAIIAVPESHYANFQITDMLHYERIYGVCSDYVEKYRKELELLNKQT